MKAAFEILSAIIGAFVISGMIWAFIWDGIQCVGRSVCI